ncbi:MAG: hypothetical protein IPL78_35425 [Chloroflexi bacterium]|nr:hypothetical protein [Chloroflexota bacterium]
MYLLLIIAFCPIFLPVSDLISLWNAMFLITPGNDAHSPVATRLAAASPQRV